MKKQMKDFKEVIAEVEALIEKPFVTARFGDNWKEHTKRMIDEGQYDLNMLLDLAWKQGRRGILLERVIEQSLSNREQEESELPVVVLKAGSVYDNKLFDSIAQARNYVAMRNPKKKWKKSGNQMEMVCAFHGTKFIFQPLDIHK